MFSICAAARGWLLILLSLLVVFPTCGHCLWLVQALAWWWHWAADLGKGSTQSLHSTSKAPLLLLAPLGAHHEEAQLPMSNFLRCSERQKQVRQEKVLPSSWPSSLIIEKSQILLSLACKMAENHLAASGTVARYQLDIAQIHQAIYHCHSCEEKELSLSCPRGMHFQAIPVLYPHSPTPVLLPWLQPVLWIHCLSFSVKQGHCKSTADRGITWRATAHQWWRTKQCWVSFLARTAVVVSGPRCSLRDTSCCGLCTDITPVWH